MARRLTTRSADTVPLSSLDWDTKVALLLGPRSDEEWQSWPELLALARRLDELPATVSGRPGWAARLIAAVDEEGIDGFEAMPRHEQQNVLRHQPEMPPAA